MNILEIVPIAAAVAFVVFMRWPGQGKEKPRCKVCGYLSEERVCSQKCQARLDMRVIKESTRWLHDMNKDKFGF